MEFDSLEAVRDFAGEDYGVAVVPPKARGAVPPRRLVAALRGESREMNPVRSASGTGAC